MYIYIFSPIKIPPADAAPSNYIPSLQHQKCSIQKSTKGERGEGGASHSLFCRWDRAWRLRGRDGEARPEKAREGDLVGALAPARRWRRRRPIGAEIAEERRRRAAIFEGEDDDEVGRDRFDPRFSDDSATDL